MVETLRLALNAADVRELTHWPDPMIEDYIQILSDLNQIINELNQALTDIVDLFADTANMNSDLQGVRAIVSQARAKINSLDRTVLDVAERADNLDQHGADLMGRVARLNAKIKFARQEIFIDYQPLINYPATSYSDLGGGLYLQSVNA